MRLYSSFVHCADESVFAGKIDGFAKLTIPFQGAGARRSDRKKFQDNKIGPQLCQAHVRQRKTPEPDGKNKFEQDHIGSYQRSDYPGGKTRTGVLKKKCVGDYK